MHKAVLFSVISTKGEKQPQLECARWTWPSTPHAPAPGVAAHTRRARTQVAEHTPHARTPHAPASGAAEHTPRARTRGGRVHPTRPRPGHRAAVKGPAAKGQVATRESAGGTVPCDCSAGRAAPGHTRSGRRLKGAASSRSRRRSGWRDSVTSGGGLWSRGARRPDRGKPGGQGLPQTPPVGESPAL